MRNISFYLIKLYGLSKLDAATEYELHIKTNPIIPDDYKNIYFINVDVENDIKYSFIISDETRINKLIDALKGKIEFEFKNITLELIDNIAFEGIELVENKKFFDDFRLNYLTTDDILEKISRCGVESLDEIDKEILYNPNRRRAEYRIEPIFENNYEYEEPDDELDDSELPPDE
jgi:hypothetical protein